METEEAMASISLFMRAATPEDRIRKTLSLLAALFSNDL
jgi:hypothetical protein